MISTTSKAGVTMRRIVRHSRRLIFCGLIVSLVSAPAFCLAYDDFYWFDAMGMQREAIATQEEAARAPLREKRMDEVGQEQLVDRQEHELYFEGVMEGSKEAAGRPRAHYYRKPGFISTDAPASPQTVTLKTLTYLYERGVFWVAVGDRYMAVAAPVGAVVNALPPDSGRVFAKTTGTYYSFGVFFAPTKENKFQVIKPPAGILVDYLPDGYIEVEVKGVTYFKFGEVYFKPFVAGGAAVYQTVDL